MTAVVVDLAAVRARRAEEAVAREAAKAAAIARAQLQARASSLAPPEPVAPEPFVEEPIVAEPEEPEPLEEIVCRTREAGYPWTRVGRAHIVIFPSGRTEGEWCLRLQYDAGPGRFLRQTWSSAAEAQRWVEDNAHTVTR
jgi:hypothetical protein